MISASRFCRAWLSFVLLQDIGVIWMCYNSQTSLLFKTVSPFAARQYSLAVALISIIRFFLLSYFDSRPLHVCHIAITAIYSLSMIAEIFYYQDITATIANIVRVSVQVVTIIGLGITQYKLSSISSEESHRRRGRLFAKHYMEGDLLNPPETDNVRELRKKQL